MPFGIRIVSQRQVAKVLDDGEVHDVVEISAIVDDEGPFRVDIPADQYHPDQVTPVIEDLAWRVRTFRGRIQELNPQP